MLLYRNHLFYEEYGNCSFLYQMHKKDFYQKRRLSTREEVDMALYLRTYNYVVRRSYIEFLQYKRFMKHEIN